MARSKVYIETSVFSYLAARPSGDVIKLAKQLQTRTWWETARQGFSLFTSSVVLGEISKGDPGAAAARLRYAVDIPGLELDEEIATLADILIASRAVPVEAATDALHIAISARHGMTFLLTWNCAHINNPVRRQKIGEILSALGYGGLTMATPEELG